MANPEHLEILKQGAEAWNGWREENPGLEPDLSEVELSPKTMLPKANLSGTRLDGAKLPEARLKDADLQGASLVGAHLDGARLFRAKMMKADMRGASLKSANLNLADMRGARLTGANLEKAELERTCLTGADLQDACLRWTRLIGADVRTRRWYWRLQSVRGHSPAVQPGGFYTDLRGADLNEANVSNLKYNRWSRYLGIRAATCFGSPRFRRFAEDQGFIEDFRSRWWRKPLYIVWLVLSDCGRSLSLWTVWSLIFAALFALQFYSLGKLAFEVTNLKWSLETMLYYSVVTFTTLGFGDVTPKTAQAARWVMAEVVTGYIMLGGLVSILATKLARRS